MRRRSLHLGHSLHFSYLLYRQVQSTNTIPGQVDAAYSDVMADEVYHGDTNADHNSTEYLNYQNGFKIGCYGLVEYSICISLGSAIMEQFNLFEKFPIKFIFAAAYATGMTHKLLLIYYDSYK